MKRPPESQYTADIAVILSHGHDNGADYWTTQDRRLLVGSPWSTLQSVMLLHELGLTAADPFVKGAVDLIFAAWRPDGRFRVAPKGAIYPCHTIHCLRALCALGFAKDERVVDTFRHLESIKWPDGGWRCNKFSFGRGPETECSNPHPTLVALDAFRYREARDNFPQLDKAVAFLLDHWTVRRPIGPCHYGIGKLFMQTEYPFGNYNLFLYVYVLSFYPSARRDPRFLEALAALESTMQDGQIVVQRTVPALSKLNFCRKGEKSDLATQRYREIVRNLAL